MNSNNQRFALSEHTILRGEYIHLVPLRQEHLGDLELCAADPRIWEHYLFDCSQHEVFQREMKRAFQERDAARQFPFVVQRAEDSSIIGSTRFLDLQAEHRKLEIGWTWLVPSVWSSVVNIEAKLLLLSFCFGELGVQRVYLKTDANNKRSRRAIEKLGAQFEGILRKDMIRDNGTSRDSAYYSILDDEWPHVHAGLRLRMDRASSTDSSITQ